MRYILFILILSSQLVTAQIRDFQISVKPLNKDSLYIMVNDTNSASTKYGLGKWVDADSIIGLLAPGGGGTTNLSIAQSGGTQVIQSSTGTDVGVRNLYGLLITEGATDTLHFRVDTAYIATLYDITQIPISSLKAATATNTINNANYAQEWQWNTLAGATGLKLSSTSTAAAGGTQKLFAVDLSGANSNAGQKTIAGYFANYHTGSTSSNYGLEVITYNGFVNIGISAAADGSVNDIGVLTSSQSGTGLYAQSESGKAMKSVVTPSSTATVVNIADFSRQTSGAAAAGIGGNITFTTETATSSAVSNTISSKWTTATHASRVSDLIFSGVNAATTADLLTIKGSGQLVAHKYGAGTFTGTPVADIFVTASGEFIEGSMTGQSWTADADDATTPVLVSNQTLSFRGNRGIDTDLIDGTVDSISYELDFSELVTVTTIDTDDAFALWDASGLEEKITYSNLITDIISDVGASADGNGIYTGDGTTPTDVDVAVTDSLEFNGTLKIINDANDYVGIGSQSPEAKLHVRGGGNTTMVIEETNSVSTTTLKSKSNISGVTPPLQISCYNKDTGVDLSGDYYQVSNITFSKNSNAGGAINFNVGYDSTNLDGVLQIVSRESGATDGYVNVVGGLRYKWTSSASAGYTLNTGDYGLTMTATGAKTATLPDAVSGIVGQTFSIFNSGASGDITLTITGGSGDTFYGDVIVSPNESVTVHCTEANSWIINN